MDYFYYGPGKCSTCEGTGWVLEDSDEHGELKCTCPSCGGSGYYNCGNYNH